MGLLFDTQVGLSEKLFVHKLSELFIDKLNKLSEKLFVDRKFVVKHIRSKHQQVLQAEQDKIQDEIYYYNFRKVWDAERQQHEQEIQAEALR